MGEMGGMGRMGGDGGDGGRYLVSRLELLLLVCSNDFSRCSPVMASAITGAISGSTAGLVGDWMQGLRWALLG
jgi:hypothetical protein